MENQGGRGRDGEGSVGRGTRIEKERGGERRGRGIQLAGQHDNKAHLKSICCNKGSGSSA